MSNLKIDEGFGLASPGGSAIECDHSCAVKVSVIVPCRNERPFVATFVASLMAQEPLDGEIEIIIADGMSDDGTREELARLQESNGRLIVIDNPGKIVSTGLNSAIRLARGHFVVRMDMHTEYAPDYIRQCVAVLEETGAMCVGGPWKAVGRSTSEEDIAKAFGSSFGSGGARSRDVLWSGPVDTVYLGSWRKLDLIRLGGFDEELIRNQDDELNFRIRRSGGVVWQDSRIRSAYVPRAQLDRLFRQFFQYGYWKVFVIRKHRAPAAWRHVLPFAGVVLALVLLLAGFFLPQLLVLLVLGGLAYLAAAVLAASRSGAKWRIFRVVGAFVCMHAGYALGFGSGLWVSVLGFRAGRVATSLSR